MRKHIGRDIPPWEPAPGDRWIQDLNGKDTVTWRWDGNVWIYVTDTIWERRSPDPRDGDRSGASRVPL